MTRTTPRALYPVATRQNDTGEVILKAVNVSDEPRESAINLRGAGNVVLKSQVIVLTSDDPNDKSSLESPNKVAPKELVIANAGSSFHHTFPPNSLTVLRLKAGGDLP